MVSSNNLIIAGLALVAGVFLLRGSSLASVPALGPADIQEDPEIGILQKLLSDAKSLFKNTFPPLNVPKGLTTGGKTFPCRGPNCLGVLGASGVQKSINPFTGMNIITGFTNRGSQKTRDFFGDISGNLKLGESGREISSSLSELIAEITNQLKIKRTNTV